MALVAQQEWCGNIRELQNFIRRVVVFSNGSIIQLEDLQCAGFSLAAAKSVMGETEKEAGEHLPYKEAKNNLLDSFAMNYMQDLLRKTGGNISETARISGLERISVQKILRRLGLDASSFR